MSVSQVAIYKLGIPAASRLVQTRRDRSGSVFDTDSMHVQKVIFEI